MKFKRKQLKKLTEETKLGPAFFVQGDKKMMAMTRPIDGFNFGFDQTISTLNSSASVNSSDAQFSNIFSSTLNSLVSDILNYFQNRIRIKIGKNITITSIPAAKGQLKKYFSTEINSLIGDKGYKELKKLDEVRGNFQHSNERYFNDYAVNNKILDTTEKLKEYSLKIKKIINELDKKLESISPSYEVTKREEGNSTVIEMKAIGHSFDLENMKINKTNDQ